MTDRKIMSYLAHHRSYSDIWRGFPHYQKMICEKMNPMIKGAPHEMIPNAWYSMIDVRLIRPRSPCCIPRLKRTIATLGDGYNHGA